MKVMKRTHVKTIIKIRRRIRKIDVVKEATQTAVYSVLPATFNDTVIHHAPLSLKELASVTSDTIIAGSMKLALEVLIRL